MYAENAPAGNSDLNNARVFERCGVGYAVQYRDRRLESFEARPQGSGIGGDASQAAGMTPDALIAHFHRGNSHTTATGKLPMSPFA